MPGLILCICHHFVKACLTFPGAYTVDHTSFTLKLDPINTILQKNFIFKTAHHSAQYGSRGLEDANKLSSQLLMISMGKLKNDPSRRGPAPHYTDSQDGTQVTDPS
jgi:hypothetical protein